MQNRYTPKSLTDFSSALFEAAGLAPDRARIQSNIFLEADLLGFTTHGLNRVSHNLRWIEDGQMRIEGDPVSISDRGNVFNWDADFLPGPWVMSQAIDQCLDRIPERGMVCATLRRSQHIACLGAYLPRIAEAGYVGIITCSTPNEYTVCAHQGSDPIYSANPYAFVAAAENYPILFDISFCITAGGYVTHANRAGEKLPGKYLKTRDGQVSDDPAVFFADPAGSILPIGGTSHGYKGQALTLMSEVLCMALGGYGRGNSTAADDGEANSVFLQIIDPEAFTSREDYNSQIEAFKRLADESKADSTDQPVRLPGKNAWQRRIQQLQEGVILYPIILQDLKPWADKFGITMPSPLSEPAH
jgi:LDH2 family malate/lactate/ureidoglycolate dehydrogenase